MLLRSLLVLSLFQIPSLGLSADPRVNPLGLDSSTVSEGVWESEETERLTFANGVSYEISQGPFSGEQRQILNGMTQEDRASFDRHRRSILSGLGRVLHSGRLAFGVFRLIGDKLDRMHDRYSKSRQPIELMLHSTYEGQPQPPRAKMAELRRQTVESTLDTVNRQLFEAAPVVSGMNEIGVNLFLAASLGTNLNQRLKIRSAGFGMIVLYNKEQKTLYLKVYTDREKYLAPIAPVSVIAGVVLKVYLHLGRRLGDESVRHETGKAIYPPGPCALTVTSHSADLGPNFTFGFPTTPFDYFLAYVNSMERRNWVDRKLCRAAHR